MFEIARAEPVFAKRGDLVVAELEQRIAAGTLSVTEILNAPRALQRMAFEYLHGTGEGRRHQAVTVVIEVMETIAKNLAVDVKGADGKTKTLGGTAKAPVGRDNRPLRIEWKPGRHTVRTDEAVGLLYHHGAGVDRNESAAPSIREARVKCREVLPAELAATPPSAPPDVRTSAVGPTASPARRAAAPAG